MGAEQGEWTCRACGVRLHAECVQSHGRCPTIGCTVVAPRPEREPALATMQESPRPLAAHVIAHVVSGLVLIPSTAAVLYSPIAVAGYAPGILVGVVLFLLIAVPLCWWLISSWVLGAFATTEQLHADRSPATAPRHAPLQPTASDPEEPPHPPWRVEPPAPPAPPRPAIDDEPAPPWTARRPDDEDDDRPRRPWRVDGI